VASGSCPRCARPVAAAGPRCVYCGFTLPPELVAEAARARAALEAEWAREGPRTLAAAEAAPAAPAPAGPGPAAPPAPLPRTLIVLELEGAPTEGVMSALGLSRFEASLRVRRGGPHLHCILPGAEADAEAARLRGQGLAVVEIPEDEVRGAEPLSATRGGLDGSAFAVVTREGRLRLEASDVLVIVRGAITREYQSTSERRRLRVASLEPGYRIHVHRRADARSVELDPAAFDFGRGGPATGAQLQLDAWLDEVFPEVPRDDSFRLFIPALAPAAPAAASSADAADALARRRGGLARPVLDNLAQFRFHSAWRAAALRRRDPTG
jgi:hypothetical protein